MSSTTLKKLEKRAICGEPTRTDNPFRICTSVKARDAKELAKKVEIATRLGSDLIELRLDCLDSVLGNASTVNKENSEIEKIAKLIHDCAVPLIATVRRKGEGGNFQGTEKERLVFLKTIDRFHPDIIDVELSTVKENPNLVDELPNSEIMISFHDLHSTPPHSRLKHIFDGIDGMCSIKKVVTYAKKFEDNISVLSLYKTMDQEVTRNSSDSHSPSLIAFCAGEIGITSRILSLLLGSPFTYACLPNDQVAPGQLSIQEVKEAVDFLKGRKQQENHRA